MKDQSKTKQVLIQELASLRQRISELERSESKRNNTEEALRESEERFRKLFECHTAVKLVIDVETGTIIDANEAAADFYGWPIEELKQMRIQQINTLPAEAVKTEMEKAVSLERTKFEFRHRRADGSIRDVGVFSNKIEIAGKELLYSIIFDITAQKRAEEAMRESEERYRALVEKARDVVFRTDEHGYFTFVNPAALRITGYEEGEIIGKHYKMFIRPDMFKEAITSFANQLIKKIQNTYSEYPILTKEGHEVWLGQNTQLIMEEDHVTGFQAVARDITERKQTEKALRESYRRLDDIIDFLPDATFVIGRDGKVIAWNRAIEEMTLIPKADMIGKGDYEYAIPFYGERRQVLIDLALLPDSEFEMRQYDSIHMIGDTLYGDVYVPNAFGGKGAYLWNTASKLRDVEGNIVGAIESIRDVTARKLIEDTLREQEIKLSSIFRAAPVGIGMVVNRVFQEANDMLCQMTGYSRKELLGQNARMLYPTQEDYDYVGHEKYRQISDKGTGTVETRWQRKDGTIIDIILSSTLLDPDDFAKGVTFTALDMTERKQAVEAVRESEERFRALSENAPDIIYTMNLLGAITYVNPSWKRILGHDKEELLGRHFIDFAMEEDKRTYRKLFKSIRDEGKSVNNYIGVMLTKDGKERLFNMNSAFNRNSEGRIIGVVGSMKDVTEMKNIEKKLSQSEKMEAIGTLAGGIAHDFNNILAAIFGYTQLAIDVPDEEHRKRYLNQVLKSGERAKNLTSQILAFSRQDKQVRNPIDIEGIVKEAMKLLRSLLPATIEIRHEIESKQNIVLSTSIQIHQVLMNLCTNAAHAMRDKGGVLQVCLGHLQLPAREHPMIADLEPGSYVRLIVKDTGHGIDPGIIDRIFDPFFTTKKIDDGTGLGLSVVYGIVKSHGGTINVQSTLGKGSTFSVYFPRSEVEIEQKSEKPHPIHGGSERVLFIDDEPFLAEIGKESLSALGYEVTVRTSTIEALDTFRTQPRKFDLVITDMTMPNMSGIQLANEIMKVRSDIPIILCTGYSEIINEETSKKFGIRAFLMKPVLLEEIARTIRKVLDK